MTDPDAAIFCYDFNPIQDHSGYGFKVVFLAHICLALAGNWVLTNSTGVPKFKQTSGHLVFQIVTRAHGREIKHLRKPGRTPGKDDLLPDERRRARRMLILQHNPAISSSRIT